MVFPIRSKAHRILSTMAAVRPSSTCSNYRRKSSASILTNSAEVEQGTHVELLPSVKRHPVRRLEASNDSMELAHECSNCEGENVSKANNGPDLKESEHFQTLAQAQAPKFMVIACADSRVCPSNILGFQPGEAFMIRNVANLVPPFENGASETNAALSKNILVIGHSSCAGIETLMRMQDDGDSSSLTHKSINSSLLNLRTYPWIEDRAKKEMLSLHGGYYDFLRREANTWTKIENFGAKFSAPIKYNNRLLIMGRKCKGWVKTKDQTGCSLVEKGLDLQISGLRFEFT
ncbi:beta carbonic anhydrase 5 [Prunus dulcis]|uniref:Carbonic anhydrase n=1 Tax=Prunus dulcis TaxID=3755 RepID=A0A4Y1QVG8_PRUDU|nr:beta carbonic anhydrase 5 [Prunus dulcis]